MKKISFNLLSLGCLVFVLLTLTIRKVSGFATRIESGFDFAAVDAYIAAQMDIARIPGVAVAIVQDDQILHLKGYGVADPTGREVNPQTPFKIFSTVKTFTALAIMELVESGQIDLDAPVQRYLPWFRVADDTDSAKITVRHLLTHTSGLSEAIGNEIPLSTDLTDSALEARVSRLSTATLIHPVGSTFEYSNANYDILGLIIQTVSGQSYETFLQEHIFEPLEMRNTYSSVNEAGQPALAMGYQSWFGIPVAYSAPSPRAYIPSGWVVSSSAEDLAHFTIAMLNTGNDKELVGLKISPENIASMQQPSVQSYNDSSYYGLGWNITIMNGEQAVWAGGDGMNYKSRIVILPEQRLAVVILINMNSVNVNSGEFELHRGIVNLLLGSGTETSTPSHYMPIFVPTIVITGVTLLFGIGIIRMLPNLLSTWRRLENRQRAIKINLGRNWPPVGLPLVWTLLLLIGFPQISSRSLQFLLLFIPDFGYLLIASSVLSVVWGSLKIVQLSIHNN